MAPDKAREPREQQANIDGPYNICSTRLFLPEIQSQHGQATVNRLIRENRLEEIFDFKPGSRFDGAWNFEKQRGLRGFSGLQI